VINSRDSTRVLEQTRSGSSEDKAANMRQVCHASGLHVCHSACVEELSENQKPIKLRIVAGPRNHRNVRVFIPIYPNTLPTVPKLSRASRMPSLVFSNLPASRSAITRLENR
jgi:hypothetical protein